MSKNKELRPPDEGADTLVTQFSVAELAKLVSRIRNALGPDDEPSAVAEQLGEQYPEMAEHLRTKIALLACGQLPPDDFEEDSIVSVGIVDDRSATIQLRESEGREIGDLVYFQSRWWIVVLRKDNKMVLKRC